MKNPFQFGRELGISSLVDRKEELAAVKRVISEGNKLFLIGPRRFGKTSILKTATDELSKTSAIVVRLDAESFPSIELLVGGIVASAAKALSGDLRKIGEQIRKMFSLLRPELDYNVSDGEWSVKFGVDSKKLVNPVLLIDALNGFETLAQSQPENRPVGLILDEFQRVIEIGGREVEGQIRSAIQTHSRTGYVFAGSKTRMLHDMLMDPTRPFYRLGVNLFLGPVPRQDFETFLRKEFTKSGFEVEESAINLIMELAEDVPFNVQMLAHQCWTALRERSGPKQPTLSDAVVLASLGIVVRQQDPFYAQLWNSLTTNQQRTLMAVVAEKGTSMQSLRVVQSIGKSSGTVRQALIAMLTMSILREDQTAGQNYYRFEDPFFGAWIRLTTTAKE
jgi:hypothetical protein